VQVQMWLTRGCPFSCRFCLDRNTKWRGFTPQRAVEEIRHVAKLFPHLMQVDIMDPIFGLNKVWRKEFLTGLQAAELDLRYWSETRADVLDEEDIIKLGALRFQMDIGMDAVSPRMIEIMMKARHPEQYIQSFLDTDAHMNRHKVAHLIYMLINYPGETSTSLAETLAFWTRYYQERPGTYGMVSVNTFAFFPGNDLYNNFADYEAKYGTRVMIPEWWKLPRGPHSKLATEIIPSSEMVEARKVGYYEFVTKSINQMVRGTAQGEAVEVFEDIFRPQPSLWVSGMSYFDDKRVQTGQTSSYHKLLNTRRVFYNLENMDSYNCSREEGDWLDRLLEDGLTIKAFVDEQIADHPDSPGLHAKLKKFLRTMISRGFLRVHLEAPDEQVLSPTSSYRAIMRTSAGMMEFRLLPAEAPRTVANFMYLARAGHFNGIAVVLACTGAYIESGMVVSVDLGPGYLLREERTARQHERGSISMNIARTSGRFSIARSDWAERDGNSTVFGRLITGWDVLDRVVPNDLFLQVEIVEESVSPVVYEHQQSSAG